MKKFFIYLALFTGGLLMVSCESNEIQDVETSELSEVTSKNFTISEGTLSVESKEQLKVLVETVKVIGPEQFYNESIKPIMKEGYEPLRPYFDEENSEGFENFVIKKGKRLKEEILANGGSIEDLAFDIEDEVILDSNFEALLNFNREIIVAGKLYRYTYDGVFLVDENAITDFRLFVENTTNDGSSAKSAKQILPLGVEFVAMDLKANTTQESSSLNLSDNDTSKANKSLLSITDEKFNFDVQTFHKNSFWQNTFGYSEVSYDWAPNGRRVKVKYWDRNYIVFTSIGVEVRFQKKVKVLWATFYQKTDADKIAVGINSLTYKYKDVLTKKYTALDYYNATRNAVMYTFDGVNYLANGNRTYDETPKFKPWNSDLINTDDLYITIFNPLTSQNQQVGLSSEQIVNEVNKISTNVVKNAIKVVSKYSALYSGSTPSSEDPAAIAKILKNGTEITLFNKQWEKSDENNITKNISIEVPLIGFTITDNGSGIKGNANIPNLSTKNYDSGSIDIYGGALYKGKWYGRRLVSTTLDKN